jgi:hypothetical protein
MAVCEGDFAHAFCRNPRSAAKDVLEADAYCNALLRNGFSTLRIAFAFSALAKVAFSIAIYVNFFSITPVRRSNQFAPNHRLHAGA